MNVRRTQLALVASAGAAASVVPDPDPFVGAALVVGVTAVCGLVRESSRRRLSTLRDARLAASGA